MGGFCSKCGAALPPQAGFCPKCGGVAGFGGTSSSPPENPNVVTPPQPAMAPQQRSQPFSTPYRPAVERDLSTIDWMVMPLKKYADFSGRSQRMEYWMYFLLNFGVLVLLVGLALAGIPWSEYRTNPQAPPGSLTIVSVILLMIWIFGTFIPSIAVEVRRFHDQDKSGWFWFLRLVPYVGGIIIIVFMGIDGTPGPNRYGPDPKGGDDADVFL